MSHLLQLLNKLHKDKVFASLYLRYITSTYLFQPTNQLVHFSQLGVGVARREAGARMVPSNPGLTFYNYKSIPLQHVNAALIADVEVSADLCFNYTVLYLIKQHFLLTCI